MQASLRRRWRRSYLYFIRYPSISSNSLSPTKDTLAQVIYSEKHSEEKDKVYPLGPRYA